MLSLTRYAVVARQTFHAGSAQRVYSVPPDLKAAGPELAADL